MKFLAWSVILILLCAVGGWPLALILALFLVAAADGPGLDSWTVRVLSRFRW